MKRFLGLLACSLSLLITPLGHAQSPLGTVAATFTCMPSKVLADPARARVYVTDTATNSLLVIDTTTLQVAATVPVGSNPADMAIAPDGNTLYVANKGSTLAAIAVVDLNALTLRVSYALPYAPKAIAAGLDGRVYAAADDSESHSSIYQFDGATGAVETSFNGDYYDNDFLQITPDGTTLLVADADGSPAKLTSFDVSTATPAALQTNSGAGGPAYQLVVSHDGKHVCLPGGAGNSSTTNDLTYLFSTADINSHDGAFDNGDIPGPLAFSPDDSIVYQTLANSDQLQVFNTQSFAEINVFSFPSTGTYSFEDTVTSLAADHTGGYVFIGVKGTVINMQGNTSRVGKVMVMATGALTSSLPSVGVTVSSPNAYCNTGQAGAFTITLSSAPSAKIKVNYSLEGPAVNGQDYALLKGTVKIKAGQTSKVITVVPQGDLGGADEKKVKLTLEPGNGYMVGAVNKGRVKIFSAP